MSGPEDVPDKVNPHLLTQAIAPGVIEQFLPQYT